ncbi:hypothetical protein ABVK25_006515 [Lepraria finkii]|uniref:DUF6594 domain-containing protein n=1 Tax=Lepraria finkii TaxID=1340010 RepID=A0ABR4B6E2_9LECA
MDEENASGSAAPNDQSTQGEMDPDSNGESAVETDAPKRYKQRLFEFCHQRNLQDLPPSEPLPFLHFKELREMNIVHLQCELAKYERDFKKDKVASRNLLQLEDLLHRYTTALRDYDYSQRLPGAGAGLVRPLKLAWRETFPKIPLRVYEASNFKIWPEQSEFSYDPLRGWLMRILPRSFYYDKKERERRTVKYRRGKPPKQLSPFVDKLARFIVAITGGLSLVVPMLIMRLRESLTKSLITVSVAVVLFAGLISLMFRASNVETLAATATYAAVLVVFVGTSS